MIQENSKRFSSEKQKKGKHEKWVARWCNTWWETIHSQMYIVFLHFFPFSRAWKIFEKNYVREKQITNYGPKKGFLFFIIPIEAYDNSTIWIWYLVFKQRYIRDPFLGEKMDKGYPNNGLLKGSINVLQK